MKPAVLGFLVGLVCGVSVMVIPFWIIGLIAFGAYGVYLIVVLTLIVSGTF